jgi:hypothetical protein
LHNENDKNTYNCQVEFTESEKIEAHNQLDRMEPDGSLWFNFCAHSPSFHPTFPGSADSRYPVGKDWYRRED